MRNLLPFGLILALFIGVNFLPPDTSFAQVKQSGLLRACVPTEYPPLVMRSGEMPGVDVEILEAVAEDLDLRLSLNTNSAMGRDFNPRNWRVTRAQCAILAGGVVASPTTRSFLETTPAHLETGWAIVLPDEVESLEGLRVGFFGGISGLDRISLSRYLRANGVSVTTVSSSAELVSGLSDGSFDAGVTEALTARQIAAEDDSWTAQYLPEELGRYPVVFGLWKGDLTLKRRVSASLERLERDGRIATILERYELAEIQEVCRLCSP